MKSVLAGIGVLGVVALVAAVIVASAAIRRGLSARDEPSSVEAFLAAKLRAAATPRRAKELRNPVALTDEVLTDARAHFADHCAVCHANDGSGNTSLGKGFYPKVPDMRLPATQNLTDGELYSIIQNGIRLTGMPAWGAANDDRDEDSWQLVHFIRHLKDLTPEQLNEMEEMNPRNQMEIEQERRERDFLNGADLPEPKRPLHIHR